MTAPKKPPRGEGSIYRHNEKYWAHSLEIETYGERQRKVVLTPALDKNGKPKLERDIINELKAKMKPHQQAKARGELTSGNVTLKSWMDTWFTDIASKKNRPKTIAVYRTMMNQYIIPSIGKVRLDKLSPAHVRKLAEYITQPRGDRPGLSTTTAGHAHRVLSIALKYAIREGKLTRNVAMLADAPRKARRTLTVLTPAHARKVLEAAADDRLRSRWAAAFYTGGRQGELLGLEIERVTTRLDLSWQLQRLSWEHGCGPKKDGTHPCGRVRGSECAQRKITKPADWDFRYLQGGFWLSRPKSEAGFRIIPLVDPLRGMIEQRIFDAATEPNPHGLLWTADAKQNPGRTGMLPLDGSPIDPAVDNRAWHAILKRAQVPDARLHDARHTTASLLMAEGVADKVISSILGHSTFAMSQKYMHVDESQTRAAMAAISARMVKDTPTSDL